MKTRLVLVLIVFLAFVLRFYNLTSNPAGLNGDEAAIGYNAYSILKTGRDEYGQAFPLAFRSFDDYKPPLYVYLAVPSVAVFGLNELGVRFPSAILGIGAVVLTYLLTKRFFFREKTALLAAFLLAVSPWHLQFTRTAYETGSLAFFTTLGLLLFPSPLAGVVFGLELFLYQSARVFIPLFFLVLLARKISWRQRLIVSCVFGIFFLVTASILLSPQARLRLTGTSVFQNVVPHDLATSFRINDWANGDNRSVRFFHSQVFDYLPQITANYLAHFRPDFFVGSATNPVDFFVPNLSTPKLAYTPTVGLLLLWELPFLITGLSFLSKKNRPLFLFFLGWLLLVPLPVALTQGIPSSVRTAAFLPALQIVTAFGVVSVLSRLRKFKWLLLVVVVYQLAYFFHMLFGHAPAVYASIRYPVYKKMVTETAQMAKDYDSVVVSTNLDVPYIFFLTYLQYDPARYQAADGGTVSGGFAETRNHFSKYSFKSINWLAMHNYKKTLFVGVRNDFPSEAHIIKTLANSGDPSAIYFARSDQ